MKSKLAFTLIELLVVVAIIALMTVMTIPFFSRYGGRSEFNLRTTEVKSLIEQMNNMAKNPEKGVARYMIKIDITDVNKHSVQLYKNDDLAAGNLIKKIDLPKGYVLAVSVPIADNYLVCDTPAAYCCKLPADGSGVIGLCTAAFNDDFVNMTASNGDGTETFKINSDPFRVSY